MKQYVCGADNGFSGFIVFIDIKTSKIEYIEQYPRDNAKHLYELFEKYKPIYTSLERPFITRGFSHVSSTNYEIFGRYCQVLEMLDLKYEPVKAATWRKALGIKAKGREESKKASIEMCKLVFDKNDLEKLKTTKNVIENRHRVKMTFLDDNRCESALISLYSLNKVP